MATNKKPSTTFTLLEPQSMEPHWSPNTRMVQNCHLVWLDESINEENNNDCRNYIIKLRQVINNVNTFTDADECIDFITDIKKERTFMMVSEAFAQIIVPAVQDIVERTKVKGVYTDITSICQTLKQAAQDCDHNAVSVSFLNATDATSKENLDTLDKSFMYTQILKEILLTIDFEQKHMNEFLTFCQEQFAGNTTELRNIEKLRKEYRDHQPIWWYTYNCFLYSMLNRALRLMEVDLIIRMGFFVRDLHNHITTLHVEQYNGQKASNSFIVYRSQGLSQVDFDQLMKTKGGLMSFNNFLSTSLDREVSFIFAESNQENPDLVGVLFEITIRPSISSSAFANVRGVSHFDGEEEILFSMHSVFRIGQVKQINGNNRIWQVDLTLTGDNDPQLHALTEQIREDTFPHLNGWYQLGSLLIQLGQFDEAQHVFHILLDQTTEQIEKAGIYDTLGMIKISQGKYKEATVTYEKALEIYQKTLPANHPDLATSYNHIGGVYKNMGEYSKALLYYDKALEIYQKTLPANHSHLAASYNDIGGVYKNMGEYPKALSYYEKALEIEQKTLPATHPSLASFYNNIGKVYYNMDQYSKALSYYEKALEIRQKNLPANHFRLAYSYNDIGAVYYNTGEYSKAFSCFEKALEIRQKNYPTNHSHLAISYNNMGTAYDSIGKYSKALSYFEQALNIWQHSLPPNHPHLQNVRKTIEFVKKKL